MPLLLVAVVAMLLQQTMATVAKTAVPVLFKAVADELGFPAELVLLYTWVFACVGIVVMLGCGAFIIRFGALRMSQVGCVLMGAGLVVASATRGTPSAAIAVICLAAVVVSMGTTVATPASSQILARYAPVRWAPLVFSIKQTGVPAGVAIASFLIPVLVLGLGWRAAAWVLAAACVAIAVALEPCRGEFDSDRRRDHSLSVSGVAETFFSVLRAPGLRMLAVAAFSFIGLQAIYTNFTVVYLTEEMHYDLATAGRALGIATLVAAPGRIVWGWVSSTVVSPRVLLVGLAIVMSASAVAMGTFSPTWSYLAVMVPLVLVSATALSWHGVLLSEIARLAAPGQAGRMTGGVLAFGTAGQIVFPLFFWLGHLAAGYPGAYAAVATPALLAAVALVRGGRRSHSAEPDGDEESAA